MPDRLERGDGERDDFAPRLAVNGDDKADAASVALVLREIEALAFKPRALALVARNLLDRRRLAGDLWCS
jgi:hypothetical protein